ncbi:GumN protein [Dissulfurispira thermophila]|uniref:GumN protein n=2 Tax=root TaxID=1 RepID=A0A7G1H234_9BACT|nr:TraB/GumN family protein [Dissulfurispira thermophila]BCB95787.1 GumN protein [Dissulfurispira thermophila]
MKKFINRYLHTVLIIFFLNLFIHIPDAISQDKKNFLWEIKSDTATVYLLGSVHFMKKDAYPLDNKIEDAFKKSSILVVEANINDAAKADVQRLMANAYYRGDDTLDKHISRDTYELLKRETERIGIPIQMINKQKPWIIALTLSSLELMKLGFMPNDGIDIHFLSRAENKKIVELEGVNYQMRLISSFSDYEQELFLLYTLKDLKTTREDMNTLMSAWRNGDVKTMEAIIYKGNNMQLYPIYEKMIYERNSRMTSQIEQFLKTNETYFVVIGAAHLIGDSGIINALKGKGYSIKQH